MRNELFEFRSTEPRAVGKAWPDGVILQAIASVYENVVDSTYAISHRPDVVVRDAPEVDGVLVAAMERRVAVEITSIEALVDQRSTRSRFSDTLSTVEREMARRLPAGIWCELPQHPFVPGFDWIDVAQRLAAYIDAVVPSLSPGGSRHEIDGVPFEFRLCYEPGMPLRFRFTRVQPSNEEIDKGLLRSMSKALRHKRPALLRYASAGFRTSLVLTSDTPLLTWNQAFRVFSAAAAVTGSDHVNDVIYALTADYHIIYCMAFQGEAEFLEALNHRGAGFQAQFSSTAHQLSATAST